jgi:AcrR family transcriptional regulator
MTKMNLCSVCVADDTELGFRLSRPGHRQVTISTEPTERPLRADARRNRERLLEAARAVLAEDGVECQVPEIARRAGVGVGTLYRHFPTKESLIAAVAQDHFARMAGLAREALAADGPAWERFEALMRESGRRFAADRGVAEILSGDPGRMHRLALHEKGDLHALVGELMAEAKDEGSMRADAQADDIGTMMCGLSQVLAMQRQGAPMSAERYLTLMLDGMRA